MKRFSKQILRQRRENPPSHSMHWFGWVVLVGFAAGVLTLIVAFPWLSLGMAVLFGCGERISHVLRKRKLDRMEHDREGESICQFARHFRQEPSFDPVVVRAVYEMTQATYARPNFPIRPADRFKEEYGLILDDIDYLAEDVAELAGRSLESAEWNPFYGKAATVADLVRFMQLQPQPLHCEIHS